MMKKNPIIIEQVQSFKETHQDLWTLTRQTVKKDDKNKIISAQKQLKSLHKSSKQELILENRHLRNLLHEIYLLEHGFYDFKTKHKSVFDLSKNHVTDKDLPSLLNAKASFKDLPFKVKDHLEIEEEHIQSLFHELYLIEHGLYDYKKQYSNILKKSVQNIKASDENEISEALMASKALKARLRKQLKNEMFHLKTLQKEIKLIQSGYYVFLEKHQSILKKRVDQMTEDDQSQIIEAIQAYKALKPFVKRRLKNEHKHLRKLKFEVKLVELGLISYRNQYKETLSIRPSTVTKSDKEAIFIAILAHSKLHRALRKKLTPEVAQLKNLLREIDIKESIKIYIDIHQQVFDYTEQEINLQHRDAYELAKTDWKQLSPAVRKRMVKIYGNKGPTGRTYFWQKRVINEAYHQQPKTWVPIFIGLTVLLIVSLWSFSSIQFKTINQQGIDVVKGIATALINPNIDWLTRFDRVGIPYQMLETVAIAFLGTFVGAILAVPLAFLSSRNITGRLYSFIGIIAVTMIRTFPVFILGLMFIKVTGPGPFAGVMTIGVASIGMMTKLYVESIEDIDKGILEALDATGATTFQKIRYGILPQLTANFVSNTLYRFEINVRNATILGLVGAGGIGSTLLWAMAAYRWKDAASALIGIIVVVLIIEVISTRLRKKIGTGE
jgi:phosphonate transport system permease protein